MSFDESAYAQLREATVNSAEALVPILMERFAPRTVVDVGCGEGWFAREFAEQGCEVTACDISVLEKRDEHPGAGHVFFYPVDLTQPFRLVASDLALCLEVAEHIAEETASGLVAALVEAAPVVVISAAVPNQGGCGHVNEQHPSYWAALFAGHGYLVSTTVRDEIHDDGRIAGYYRQNLLIAATAYTLGAYGLTPNANPEPATW